SCGLRRASHTSLCAHFLPPPPAARCAGLVGFRSAPPTQNTTHPQKSPPPPPLRSRQFAYLHRPTRLEVRIAGHEGFGIVSRGGSDANISNQVPGDVRRGATLSHADPAADLTASFEYTFLSESLQIRVPGTRIVRRRIVVHQH